jgi:hypothetical protein
MSLNKNFRSILFCILILPTIAFSQENAEFVLCGNQKTHPYYHPKLKYQGDFWEIKNHFKTKYKEKDFVDIKNNSGLVTIQFAVNCEGKTGKFVTQSCDLNYTDNEVNTLIVQHLLCLTKELKNWIAAIDENNLKVNSHAFLSFRIENGKIIEILPN